MTPQELFTKSLMTYDNSDGSHDLFYYNLPYIRNYDLCNWKPHGLYSGNIVKFYQYNLDKPVVLFTDTEEIEVPKERMTDPSPDDEMPEESAAAFEDDGTEDGQSGEFQAFADSELETIDEDEDLDEDFDEDEFAV